MIPSNQQAIINALQMTCGNLTNNNPGLSAYPQLSSTFYQLASNLDILVGTLISTQRDELLFGKTPAAKLYELQYKQSHAVPECVLKSALVERWDAMASKPLIQIMNYVAKFRSSLPNEFNYSLEHRIPSTPVNPQDVTQTMYVKIDTASREVIIKWVDCALILRIPSLVSSTAFVEGPLFHEPIKVSLDPTFLENAVWNPVYVGMVGDEHIEVGAPKYLLMDHYFTSGRVSSEDIEHPVVQLRSLLSNDRFGQFNMSYAKIDWQGWSLHFSTERDWSREESLLLVVNLREQGSSQDTRNFGQHIRDWWKNPLLVNDLLKDMDGLIDQLLTQHAQEATNTAAE